MCLDDVRGLEIESEADEAQMIDAMLKVLDYVERVDQCKTGGKE